MSLRLSLPCLKQQIPHCQEQPRPRTRPPHQAPNHRLGSSTLRNIDADECGEARRPLARPCSSRLRRVVLSAAGGGRARALLAHMRASVLACLGNVSLVLARLAHGAGALAPPPPHCALGEVALLGRLCCLLALATPEIIDVCDLSSAFFQVRTHAIWTADADTNDRPQTLATLAGSPTARAPRAQALQGTRYATACEGRASAGRLSPHARLGASSPAAPSASVCVELVGSRRWAPSDGLVVIDHDDFPKPVVAHK
jgi:hypothetical protein